MLTPAWLCQQHTSCSSGAFSPEKGAHFLESPQLKHQQCVLASFQINFLSTSHPSLGNSKLWFMCRHCCISIIIKYLFLPVHGWYRNYCKYKSPKHPHNSVRAFPRAAWESRGLGMVGITQNYRALGFCVEELCTSAAFSIMGKMEIRKPNKSWRSCPSSLGTGLPPGGWGSPGVSWAALEPAVMGRAPLEPWDEQLISGEAALPVLFPELCPAGFLEAAPCFGALPFHQHWVCVPDSSPARRNITTTMWYFTGHGPLTQAPQIPFQMFIMPQIPHGWRWLQISRSEQHCKLISVLIV